MGLFSRSNGISDTRDSKHPYSYTVSVNGKSSLSKTVYVTPEKYDEGVSPYEVFSDKQLNNAGYNDDW